jgi:hypothetical protein
MRAKTGHRLGLDAPVVTHRNLREEWHMKAAALLVVMALTTTPALAQQSAPIHAAIDRAAQASAEPSSARPSGEGSSAGSRRLFWSGVALGAAGVMTSTLGLTVLRTENSSTGNAPTGTYAACVAQKNSDPVYATNQCDGLKAKNLKLLWGGVALSGVGAVLMIRGSNTSASLSPTSIGLFHHVHF